LSEKAQLKVIVIRYLFIMPREEKHVLKEYGEVYLRYKENTPMFFPIKLPSRRKKLKITQVNTLQKNL
jgi:hypothetical protein